MINGIDKQKVNYRHIYYYSSDFFLRQDIPNIKNKKNG